MTSDPRVLSPDQTSGIKAPALAPPSLKSLRLAARLVWRNWLERVSASCAWHTSPMVYYQARSTTAGWTPSTCCRLAWKHALVTMLAWPCSDSGSFRTGPVLQDVNLTVSGVNAQPSTASKPPDYTGFQHVARQVKALQELSASRQSLQSDGNKSALDPVISDAARVHRGAGRTTEHETTTDLRSGACGAAGRR